MRKLVIGCGVLAALVTIALVVGGMFVSSWFKSRFPDADVIDNRQAEMRERFGEPDAYTPPLDGHLPIDRIERFVAVRESLIAPRYEAAAALGRFVRHAKHKRDEKASKVEKAFEAIGMARGGTEMVSNLLGYYGAQQKLLLNAGMGEGEYAYWHAVTALSWLGWDPLASPEIEDVLEDLDMKEDASSLRGDLLRTYRKQLRNARRELEAKTTRTPDEQGMLQLVVAELDGDRPANVAPFASSFPAPWAAALEPYRSRIQGALPREAASVALDLAFGDSDHGHARFTWSKQSKPHDR